MSRVPSLQQLRAFRVVMSARGITQAAHQLNLSQPALSKQISLLEESLGI